MIFHVALVGVGFVLGVAFTLTCIDVRRSRGLLTRGEVVIFEQGRADAMTDDRERRPVDERPAVAMWHDHPVYRSGWYQGTIDAALRVSASANKATGIQPLVH